MRFVPVTRGTGCLATLASVFFSLGAAALGDGLTTYTSFDSLAEVEPYASIPATYFRNVAYAFKVCLPVLRKSTPPVPAFCRDSQPWRVEEFFSSESLSQGTRDALSDPDFFRKCRLLIDIRRAGFAARVAQEQPYSGAARGLSLLALKLDGDDIAWTLGKPVGDSFSGDEKAYRDRFLLFCPNLLHHLELNRLTSFFHDSGFVDVWANPIVASTYRRFEKERILGLIPDSMHSNLPNPAIGPVRHKLVNLLHDAVWINADKNVPINAYLFGQNWEVTRVDSAAIAASISAFGVANAKLAVRINRREKSTWFDPRLGLLDSAVEVEADRILSERLSEALRIRLSKLPLTHVEFDLKGWQYGDYLGTLKLRRGVKSLKFRLERLSSVPSTWKDILFPFTKTDEKSDLGQNYMRLILGSRENIHYSGDISLISKLIEGQLKI